MIAPHLSNFYVSDYPQSVDLTTLYVDDFTAAESSSSIPVASQRLSAHAGDVAAWAEDKGLSISVGKSHPTLFTSDSHQSYLDPEVTLNGASLQPERNPKILGIHFDPHLNFAQHARETASRALSRLRILKALAGTTWGQQKETLMITQRALIKSVIQYGAPVWFPNASRSSIAKLQVVQNAALQVVTGCHRMASVSHLHQEASALPVENFLSLLSKQYLAFPLVPGYPSNRTVTANSGPRKIKNTLQSRFYSDIRRYFHDGFLDPPVYADTIKALHCDAVSSYISTTDPNKVLCVHPPPFSPEESTLWCYYGTTLAQLRSRSCIALNSCKACVGVSSLSSCSGCGYESHTVPQSSVALLSPLSSRLRICGHRRVSQRSL